MKNFFIFIFLIILSVFVAKESFAFIPKIPIADPWFTYTISPDGSVLPDGVFLSKDSYGNNIMYNNTEYPIYLVKKNNEAVSYENSDISSIYKPEFKLTKDKFFIYRTYNSQISESGTPTGWYQMRDSFLPMSEYWAYKPFFLEKNNVVKDDRPVDVIIPKEEHFNILLLYKDKEIIMPVSVVYSLNENYNPNAYIESKASIKKESSPLNNNLFLFLGIVLFLVLGSLFYFNKKKTN